MRKPLTWVVFCCTLLLSTFAGSSDQTPSTPQAFLDRVAAARGKLEPGRYVYVEQTTDRSGVSTSTYHSDGTDWVVIWKVGPFTTSSGESGGQRWDRTINGTVLLDSQFHRDDPNAVADAHPDDPKNRVSLSGPNRDNQYVLEFNPPSGYREVRYYDAATLELVRDVFFALGRKRVTEYSDYRRVYGQLRPFLVHYSDGQPENDRTTKTLSFDRVAHDDVSLAIPVPQPLYTVTADDAVKLVAQLTSRGLVLPASINGHEANFILDSGASDLTIDPKLARAAGMKFVDTWEQSTQTGDFGESLAEAQDLDVGPISMHDVQFMTAPMQNVGDVQIAGLLGCDFLAASIVEINFKTGSVVLHPRGFDPASAGARAYPMQVDDCVPRVNATFEGVPGNFLLDTGSFALILEPDYVNRLRTGLAGYDTGLMMVGGSMSTQELTVSDLVFGGIDFKRNVVVVPQSSIVGGSYDGLFGRNLLQYYVVYLDYFDRTIYLKPNL